MEQTPSVSVAMATYNGARFLRPQLHSLARQSRRLHELVVCDDQSSDDTIAVLEEFARGAPFPVRIHRNPERLHFGGNFLKAAGLCEGDLVAFCDQDDVWHPDKVEKSVEALSRTDVVLCSHDATEIDEQGEVIGHHSHSIQGDLIEGHDLGPWTVFFGFTCTFRRSLLDLIPAAERPIDIIDPTRQMSHDRWVCFLASLTGRIAYLHQSLADYRQHGDNASGWMRSKRSLGALHKSLRDKAGFYLEKRRVILSRLLVLAEQVDFRATAPSVGQPWSTETLERARATLRHRAQRYEKRLRVIAPDRRSRRFAALVGAWRDDAYRLSPGGRTCWKSFAQDAVGAWVARPGQLALAARELTNVT